MNSTTGKGGALMPKAVGGQLGRESGIALVVVLGITLIVGLLVLASAMTGLIDRGVSANQYRSNGAYYLAQTGIEVYKTAIFRNLVDHYESTETGWCESPIEGGIDLGNGTVLAPGTWTAWVNAHSGPGRYRVRYDPDGLYFVLTSEGELADALSTVQLIAGAGGGPGSAWDNAILARGATPGSKAINGNVAIYGSLHIVRGDIDGTFAIGGTSGVFNDYTGAGTQTNIVADVTNIVDPNVDLCARVKIAEGDIYLESGAVRLGSSSEPIYSIHLGDGVVCNEKDHVDKDCKPNKRVNDHFDSDLVWLRYPEERGQNISSPYGPYDQDLPVLSQEALDIAFATDVGGVPVSDCDWLYQGSMIVLPPASSGSDSAVCGDDDNSIQWMAGPPGYLAIEGHMQFPIGNVEVRDTLLYEGLGSVIIGAHLEDSAAKISFDNGASIRPRTNRTYPLGSAIGILSTGDVSFGSTAAEGASAALIYAKGTFEAKRQVTIVGAVIAEDFDLGTNVPRIAYHPDVRFAADLLCLPGTACAGEGVPQNPGILADISIERR